MLNLAVSLTDRMSRSRACGNRRKIHAFKIGFHSNGSRSHIGYHHRNKEDGNPSRTFFHKFTVLILQGLQAADAAADSGKHGMGIGLSVCAAIVKAHGGEIQAESKVGEGTTIRFWLETESIETEENEDEQ